MGAMLPNTPVEIQNGDSGAPTPGRYHRAAIITTALVLAQCSAFGQTPISVLTRNYNNQRTGANITETTLNTSNVNAAQFGRLFMLPVDDQIYAGVLYVPGLQIAGGTHNVIYVATMNNSVYAFDADTLGPPLWFSNFNGSGQPSTNLTVLAAGCAGTTYNNFLGDIGITSTPVIDGTTNTMYFVTRTELNGATTQALHAINILTGADIGNSPQVISATVSGTGDGGTTVTFNPATQNQRPALALSQGVVYIAWASFCDANVYHGWVMAYNETTLAQVGVYNDSANGTKGGIWMAGAGPTFDSSGNVFYATGNGTWDGSTQLGEALVKLSPGSLNVLDYFTPSDYSTLNANDLDFGSAGPTFLTGTSLAVQGGKEGKLYLLNTGSLGHEESGDVQIPQVFQAVDVTVRPSATHHIHNANPVWNSPEGLNVYVWGENDFLHLFQLNPSTQTLGVPALATGTILPPQGMPGGMMILSANGSQAGTGVLWAAVPRAGDANPETVPGNLYAFNAENLNLLWSSTGPNDDLLNFSKGSAPVEVNGKVYAGSLSRFVDVYGLQQSAPVLQDLALNQNATSTTPCNSDEGPNKALNGSASQGLDDKWCSGTSGAWMQVDLGTQYTISRFVVEHAGAGGEGFNLNTSAFNIQVSPDGVNYTTVVTVTGNVDSITTHDITPVTGRYVKLNIVTPNQSVDDNARIYEFQVFGPLTTPTSADFSISATPGNLSVTPGNSVTSTVTISPLNGFTGTVNLSALGLPVGATAGFNPSSVTGSGTSILTISTTSSTPLGAWALTVAGAGPSSQHAVSPIFQVNSSSSTGGEVNLSADYNELGMVTDGTNFSVGIGGEDYAYSATLLGSSVNWAGLSFGLGPPNVPNALSSSTVELPACQCSTLAVLATGLNGNQTSQVFTVTYTDGTTATFTQSLSDWFTPQNYSGESEAVTMAYRDLNNGTKGTGPFYLYGYTFALNSSKTVSSVTLPQNFNVVVLAITVTTGGPTPSFSLTASPGSQTVAAGSAATYTATVTAQNGFTGTVTLSASGLPSGVTAGFNPTSITGSGTSTVTLSTSSTTPAGSSTVTITGTSGSVQQSCNVTLGVTGAPSFTLSASPGTQNVTVGNATTYAVSIAAVNGFTGTVTLGTGTLPSGVTAGFNPTTVSGSGTSTLTLTTSSTTPVGVYTVSITGTSGTLQQSSNVTLEVNSGATGSGAQVNMTSAYNRLAMVTDGTTFSGGIDGGGSAYSANLLGSSTTWEGLTFVFGPPNVVDSVSYTTVTLPSCQCSTLAMLATGVNGSQASQTFVVNYTDGSNSTFTQSLSDWHTPQNYSGESIVVSMGYRDKSNGTEDARTFDLYGYSFALNSSKTVSSIVLPQNSNVVVLAMTLSSVSGFSITAGPSSQTVTQGGGTSYTATVTAQNGFTGTVTLGTGTLPTGVTAGFNPTTVSGSGTSTVTLTTSATTPTGSYTVAITGTSGSLQQSTNVTLVVNAPANFTLTASPSSQSVTQGGGTSYTATVTAQNGFTGTVTLGTGTLPTGVTAGFSPTTVSGSGTSTVTLTTSTTTPTGSYTVAITGTSGSLQQSTNVTLVVGSTGGGGTGTQVNMSSAYDHLAMVTDGTTFSGGIDGGGSAYSANLLGSSTTWEGLTFVFGPPNVVDAVSYTTVTLPSCQCTTLAMLATGVNGNQASQTFVVNYTDGTKSTFTQSLSDWFTPQNYSGESIVVSMAYRDKSNGTEDNRTFDLYGYSFALNSSKTVSSIVLPQDSNVVVLAMTLVP